MQNYTSSATSVNRSKLPAVYRKATLSKTTPFVVDYGCGKYIDHIRKYLAESCKELYPYDPYNQPKVENLHTVDFVRWASRLSIEVDIVCSNVLNVIDSDGEVSRIANDIERVVKATGGHAYITVYEGDRSGVGRPTGKDQYQRNEPIREYLRFFHNGVIRNGMIVISS